MKHNLILAILTLAASTCDAGVLLSFDFNGGQAWPAASTDVMPSTPIPVEPASEVAAVGSVGVANTTAPSAAMLFTIEVGDIKTPWEAALVSGQLPVKNAESNLAKLTLSFDLATSTLRPVTVRVESFNANKRRTGGLETVVYPDAAEFLQRFAVDLSSMKSAGAGKFNPTDPHVQLTFQIEGPAWPSDTTHKIRIDNVCYASASLYVSPKGDDNNDGKTESTALATPQKAVDLAKPGDIVLLMDGTYSRPAFNTEQDGVVHFEGAGTPAAWIVVKNYPGHKPVLLNSDSWDTVRIGGTRRKPDEPEKEVAYFEVRGLHLLGQADKVKEKHAADIGLVKPTTNGNGITVDSRKRTKVAHHVRIADNRIELMPGGGVSGLGGDWITVENNDIRNNCWFMIYAGSGISLLSSQNFDAVDNVYKALIRNNRVSWNRCYMPWAQIKKMSDGNGIIVDTNNTANEGTKYLGRTLIQNNLCVANGGSAIHSFKSRRVDIVNNTAYLSGATPELAWGQIFVQLADDVNVVNNVMIARDNQPVNTVSKDTSDKGNTNVRRSNNIYFGGGTKPIMGTDDLVANPGFVKPSVLIDDADFRLSSDSPAIGYGKWDLFVPLTDIDGKPRPLDRKPDAGAFQR